MNGTRRATPVIAVVLANLLAMQAFACRYSVRDTGFVDLGDEPYRLVLSGQLPPVGRIYAQLAARTFRNANIHLVTPDTSAPGESALLLQDATGRTLELARGAAVPTETGTVTTLLEGVALSPARSEIQELALKSMAVLVVVDGTNAAGNARVLVSAEEAIRSISRGMASLPKPAGAAPALVRIPMARQAQERITLWGLGFDPAAASDPRVAIIFGRGRRLGAPLEGAWVTRTALEERLGVIGQDCECDLDRAWMKGPLLPARWPESRQQQAVLALGFDPENPMVRTEISLIVLRGQGSGQRRAAPRSATTLGYSEGTIDDIAPPVADQSTLPRPSSPAPDGLIASPSIPPPNDSMEPPRRVAWMIVAGTGSAILLLAARRWQRIRREQG